MVLALWLYFGANQYSTCFFFNVWLEPTWGIYLLNPGSALFFFITGCLLKEYLEKDYIYWKYGVLFLGIFWGGIGSLVLLGGIISFF